MNKIILAISAILLASCNMVSLTPEGRNVAIMTANQLPASCVRTGSTTASVVNRVVVQRSEERVREELQILASNAAASRGDTIVATTSVVNGTQEFDIYRCRG